MDNILNKVPPITYTEAAELVDFKAFDAVVRSRRSVRVYDGSPIPEQVMRDCLDAALLAPNSSNLQPWEFFWVKSDDNKKKLVEICLGQPSAKTAAELVVAVARTRTWHQHAKDMVTLFNKSEVKPPKATFQYYEKIIPLAYEIGPLGLFGLAKKIVLSVVGLFRVVPREPTSKADLRVWAVKSTTLACENFMLAMRASNFDTCAMEGYDSARLKKLLNLPRDAEPVMVISCGKRASNGVYGPRIRFESSKFIKEI